MSDAGTKKRPWWPFFVVLGVYVPARMLFVQSPGPLPMVVAVLDPITLGAAIVLGLAARMLARPR